MEYQGIRYNVIQGIERSAWRWSGSIQGMSLAGQAETKSDAIAAAESAIDRAMKAKKCGLSRLRNHPMGPMTDHLDPNLTARQITARILFSCAATVVAIIAAYFMIRWLAQQ